MKEILIAARDRIKNPTHWTQGCSARDEHGERIDATDRHARTWCAFGACVAASGRDYHDAFQVLNAASRNLFGMGIVTLNDTMEHADVMRAFDQAIEVCDVE